MTPTPQFAPRRNCQVSRSRDTSRHNYLLDLDFRRAVQRVPVCQRPSLRTWLRRYARTLRQLDSSAVRPTAELPGVALARHTRTFHELEPATGHWRRL